MAAERIFFSYMVRSLFGSSKKKKLCRTLVPSHGVIKVIEAKILNLYKSLNSPQVKHNYSPINRTSGLGVVDGENFAIKEASDHVRKKNSRRRIRTCTN